MSPNGKLLASELGMVEGLPLGKKTVNAYLRMKAAAKAAGIDIWIAQPIGAYRSYEVQKDMKINPAKYGLSTVSTVSIASAGYSTHGLGNAIDIGSFGSAYGTLGAKRSAWLILHGPEFGFYREFGDKDPNHFHHDGFTAVEPLTTGVTGAGGNTTPIKEEDMPLTDDDVNKITQGLRNAVWLLGPNGEALRYEQAIKDIANRQATGLDRQVGYGRRIEDVQDNLLPAALTNIAGIKEAVVAALGDVKIPVDASAVAKALAADAGFIAAVAKATADENDKRARARLG